MPQKLNMDNWERRDHFNFFRQFEEPFFGVTISVECTTAYHIAKQTGTSFFLYYLHKSLQAANEIEQFKYRIQEDEIMVYDQVNASPTVNRKNGTFGFAYMNYYPDFTIFISEAQKEIDKVQDTSGLVPAISGENVIHYSSIPWLNFTSISHARAFSFKDSIPKITFGKMPVEGGKRVMPVSIHVHHALMDGYHVAQFVELFQELMNRQ